MQVYAREAIYDDPWSFCDTRYKIAGQWYGMYAPHTTERSIATPFHSENPNPLPAKAYTPQTGIPKLFNSNTLSTEVVSSTPTTLSFKLRQHYSPKLTPSSLSKAVNSLVTLTLVTEGDAGEEKVKYHKDMWNEKDYSHSGLGALMKRLNGDFLTGVTKPPKGL